MKALSDEFDGEAGSTRFSACGFQNALEAILGVVVPELV